MFRLFKQGNTAKLIIAITTSQFSTGTKFTASAITATFYKLNGTNDDLEIDTNIGASGVVTLAVDKLGKTGWHAALIDFSAITAKQYVVVLEATVDSVTAIAQEFLDVSAELARLTEARLSQLDEANLPTDVADVPGIVWTESTRTLTSFGVLADDIGRVLGLVMENLVEEVTSRDSNGNKTASVIYIYDSAANATTHDKSTGLVASYDIAASYTNNLMDLFKSIKAL